MAGTVNKLIGKTVGGITVSEENRPYTPIGVFKDFFKYKGMEVLLEGPAGCVHGDTQIYLPLEDQSISIREIHKRNIRPVVQTLIGPVRADVPFIKGVTEIYEVKTESQKIRVTKDHLFLTRTGWRRLCEIPCGEHVLIWREPYAPRWKRRAPDSHRNYQECPDSCGGRPLGESGTYQDVSRQPTCVLGCTRACYSRDDQASKSEHRDHSHDRPSRASDHLSKLGCSRPLVSRDYKSDRDVLRCTSSGGGGCISGFEPSETDSCLARSSQLLAHGYGGRPIHARLSALAPGFSNSAGLDEQSPPSLQLLGSRVGGGATIPEFWSSDRHLGVCNSCERFDSRGQWEPIQSVEYSSTEEYYDLTVPEAHHYLADGFWNHNTGKSIAALNKMHAIMEKYPGARGLILRKERSTLGQTTLTTFEDKVVPKGHPILDGADKDNRKSYQYPNGSELVPYGLDRPSKTFSSEYDIVFIDEAIEVELGQYEGMLRSLRHNVVPYQQIWAITNPGPPTNWLNNRQSMKRFVTRHQDNPYLFDTATGLWTPAGKIYIEDVLGAYTGVRRLRMLLGIWAAAEGIVYDDFNPAIHLIERFEIPADWKRFVIIDFGFRDPFVAQWWALDKDGRAYLYREIYQTGVLVEDHAKNILKLSEGEQIDTYIADTADAEGRATLAKRGIETEGASKDIEMGIQAVKSRLAVQKDKKPRFFVLKNSLVKKDVDLVERHLPTCFEDEITGYIWNDKKKDKPVDKDNHSMDCTRYAMMYLEDGDGGTTWEFV